MAAVPELSIIIPVLNEVEGLQGCWETLAAQQAIALEVLFVDGGSHDGTVEFLQALALRYPDRVRVCRSERGRGRQLNLGAAQARAPWLLFLHADCRLTQDDQLALALSQMITAVEAAGHERLAGHFALRFAEPKSRSQLGYYYYQAKARLDRPGCTHGDQGFLLSWQFFALVGPFEESLPALEDTRLAERVRKQGQWLLLPGDLLTSPRRFEVEGLWQRQLINALIMNFASLEWSAFFERLPDLYRSQDRSKALQLTPFFRQLRGQLAQLERKERWSIWCRTGGYVRSQGWQPAFALDVRAHYRMGLPVGSGATPRLKLWDRWLDPLTDNLLGRLLAMSLVWFWFQFTWRWCRWAEGESNQKDRPPANSNNAEPS